MTNLEALTKLEELLLKSKQPIPNAGTTEDQPLPAAQSNSALLFHFASQTHATVKALLDAASTPAPKKSHKGFGMSYNGPINPNGAGSGTLPFVPGPQDPNDPLPSPVLPDSGSPDTSIPSDQESTYNLTGFLDKLPEFFQAIAKGDPVALQRLMGYIYNLTAAGLMNQDVMNQLDKADTMTGIMIAMTQGMEEAFFCGYQSGGGPVQNGIAGASQWIQDMLGKLNAIPGGQDNKYIDQMKGALEGLAGTLGTPSNPGPFAIEHTDPKTGDLIWVGPTGAQYDWTNPTDNDQYMIFYVFIRNSGVTGSPPYPSNYIDDLNNNMNSFMADYRINALEDLLRHFKDPIVAISLWIMLAYDRQFNDQESSLASTTDLLTRDTNQYATPLLQFIQSLGNLDPTNPKDLAAVQTFVDKFFQSEDDITSQNKTESIASDWMTNVYQYIGNTNITFNPPGFASVTASLFQIMTLKSITLPSGGTYQITAADRVQAFNELNPPPPSTGAPSPTPTLGQGIINALQQGGSLITGTSKTVSTQLSTVANTDNEVIKLGDFLVGTGTSGGGIVSLEQKLADNQISK